MTIQERIRANAAYKAEMSVMLADLKEGETFSDEQKAKYDELKAKVQANHDVIAKAAEVASFEGAHAPVINSNSPADIRASEEYKKGFDIWLKSRGRQLPEILALSEGGLVSGGVELPTQFAQDIITLANGDSATFGLVNVVPTTQDLVLPYETAKGSAAATAEGAAYHNSDGTDDPAIATKRIGAYKLTRAVSLTEEAFADIPALQGYCTQNLGSQIGEGMEAWLVNGNGTTQPEGVLTAAQTGITTASPTDIDLFDEVTKLVGSLKSAYLSGAAFLMNRSTATYLHSLTNAQGIQLWPYAEKTLFGFPVYQSDAMPAIAATKKAILFGDFKRAAICGVRGGLQVRIADQEDAKLGKINFYASRRLDQKMLVPEAIKALVMHA